MDGLTNFSSAPHDQSVMQSCLQNAYKQCWSDRNQQHATDFANVTANFAKTAALYLPGAWGRLACAALFAADEAKVTDSKHVAADFLLGASKGLALKTIGQTAALNGMSPVTQGALLGLGSRLTDVSLTRSTYMHSGSDRLDLACGVSNIWAEISDGRALLADAGGFALAHTMMSTRLPSLLGRPHLAATISGATFGLMDGAASEVKREQANGEHMDYGKVIRCAAFGGSIDAAAAQFSSRFSRQSHLPDECGKAPGEPEEERSAIEMRKSESEPKAESAKPIPAVEVTHSYSDVERQLLCKFGHRFTASNMQRLPEAFDNISNRVTLESWQLSSLERIYGNIDTLFEPAELLPQVQSDGAMLAKQLLIQVGDPRYVQQGDNPTCTVAALEHRLFAKDPEQAVDMLLQAVTTAAYKPAFKYRGDRFTVKLNPHTLVREMPTADPYDTKHHGAYRSHVSQIIQYVIPNIHWQSPLERSKYDRDEKLPHYFVVDYKTHPPTTHDFPHLSASETQDIYEAITGSASQFHFSGRHCANFEQFTVLLKRAGRDDLFPLLLTVDARRAPFAAAHQSLTGNPIANDLAVHDICLSRYDASKGAAVVHNPWGRQAHPSAVAVDLLFNSLYRTR